MTGGSTDAVTVKQACETYTEGNDDTVANLSGTSWKMIQDHYGHLQQEHAASALAGLAL